MSRTVDIAAILDNNSWSAYQKVVTVLAALAIVFDGFDIQILGFAIPSMMREWHMVRAAFGPVLAVGLAGMGLGGPFAGFVGDPDPFTATMNALQFFRVSRVVISTLPETKSGWLRGDLIERVRRYAACPVEHVVAGAGDTVAAS